MIFVEGNSSTLKMNFYFVLMLSAWNKRRISIYQLSINVWNKLRRLFNHWTSKQYSQANGVLDLNLPITHAVVWLPSEGNMGLDVHTNHEGVWGTGQLGSRDFFFYILHLLATLSPPEWFCIKVGSCVSHFNVSLIVWAKSQDSAHKPPFWRESKGELVS